ncbi:MAG: L7Ae/L30e/S12e/Gadd45 family ribosomal protein [[Eubacterium] siraeum]
MNFSTLGLCRKSGRLIHGFDPVCEELKPEIENCGVILASDVSEKTQKEMRFFCDKYSALLSQCDCTMDEIKSVLGKRTGVLAVLDEGLYASLTGEHKGK